MNVKSSSGFVVASQQNLFARQSKAGGNRAGRNQQNLPSALHQTAKLINQVRQYGLVQRAAWLTQNLAADLDDNATLHGHFL